MSQTFSQTFAWIFDKIIKDSLGYSDNFRKILEISHSKVLCSINK